MADKYCTICYGRGYYLDNFMRKQECKRCQSSSLAEREAKVRSDAQKELMDELARVSRFEFRSAEDALHAVRDKLEALIATKGK